MFDIGFGELVLVAIVALLVIGPEKLPHAIRMVAAYSGRLKRAVNDLKYELESEVEAQELKKRLQQDTNNNTLMPAKENSDAEAALLQTPSSPNTVTQAGSDTRP